MRRLGLALVGAAIAAPFYMLLIDTTALPELCVIPVVAILAGLGLLLTGGQGPVAASLSPPQLLAGWRAIARVPRDVGLVCGAVVAQLVRRETRRGELRAVRFRGGEEGGDIGRAALTESLGSLAPNTIVVGVDLERNLLLVHQLKPRGGGKELDVLRLG